MKKIIILCAILVTAMNVQAKKPDWPSQNGMGIIGFGLIELQPGEKSQRFRFTYEIPSKYSGQLESAQMMILPAKAVSKYNNIPQSALISHVSGKQHLPNVPINLSTEVEISEPGLYIVAYGPWNGLLTFDDVKGTENYKISASGVGDSQIKWVDQDAGDFTVVNLSNEGGMKAKSADSFYMRVRIIRDKGQSLMNKSMSRFGSLSLHPKAAERVNLIDANW